MDQRNKVVQMGWDGHRRFSRISGRDASGRVVRRERVEHKDRAAMREQLRQWPSGTPVVLEATFGWGWMADVLAASGLVPRLANSTKLAKWRKARGLAKSNRLDGDLLSELPSQTPPWWEVWLAPPAVREQREWLRHRMSLVAMQTMLKNRLHAVLHRHGVWHEYADLFGVAGRRFLNSLVSDDPAARAACGDVLLPESARATLKANLQLLDHVRRQIARVTQEVRRQVARSPIAERLRTIPGIGWVLAYTLLAEIGEIARFSNARHLASYSLLAPIAQDSGDEHPDVAPLGRHVGFIGRRTLKWAFIEAAHSAVRHGGRFRAIYDCRTDSGKRDRNRGMIAVAHELCRLAYVVWSKEVDYTDTPPSRPGERVLAKPKSPAPSRWRPRGAAAPKSRSAVVSSRSVTGQPDVAMAAAE